MLFSFFLSFSFKPAKGSCLEALVLLFKFLTHQTRGQVQNKETKLKERKKNKTRVRRSFASLPKQSGVPFRNFY